MVLPMILRRPPQTGPAATAHLRRQTGPACLKPVGTLRASQPMASGIHLENRRPERIQEVAQVR